MTDLGLRIAGTSVCRVGAAAAAAAGGAEAEAGAVAIPSSGERDPRALRSSAWLKGLEETGGGTGADEAPLWKCDEDAVPYEVERSGDCEDDAARPGVQQLGFGDNARDAEATVTAEDPVVNLEPSTWHKCPLLAASVAVSTAAAAVLLLLPTSACAFDCELRGVSGTVGRLRCKLLGGAGARSCANSANSSATSPRSKPVRTAAAATSAFPEIGLLGGSGKAGSLTDNSMASRPCTLSHLRPGLPP